jgi:hypothetical protein
MGGDAGFDQQSGRRRGPSGHQRERALVEFEGYQHQPSKGDFILFAKIRNGLETVTDGLLP